MSFLRQTLRSLRQKPAFATAALLTIALGIGANTAVFAVVHAVLLAPLPFRQPERVVQLWETHPELHNLQVSVPDYLDWKKSLQALEIAAYTFQAMDKATVTGYGQPFAIQGTNASSDLFPLLGIKPLLGRLYNGADEQSKQPVILISEQLWRSKFSSDTRVIGRSLPLGKSSFTIVGVIPQKQAFPIWADVWIPASRMDPELYSTRKYHPLEVIGRLKPGIATGLAELELENESHVLSAAYPATNGKIGAFLLPLSESVTGEVRPALVAVWLAAGLVLLIACANLAQLMLTRALDRRNDIALRLALGANRWEAFQVFLTETALLAVAGAAAGLLAARAILPVIARLAQGQLPRLEAVQLNFPVLLFGFAASAAVAFIFALPAYLQIFRAHWSSALPSVNTRISVCRSRLSPAMMAAEVAISVAVLLAAILIVRSFRLTIETPPGFQADNVMVVHSPLANADWQRSYQLFENRIAPALRGIPGIEQVGAVNSVPMSLGTTEHSRYATRFGIAGRQFEPGRYPTAQIRWCTDGYFRVLGIPLVSGRWLTEADHGQPRYLINQTFARQFFPNSNPVGKVLILDFLSPHPESIEIAGVVGDVREFGLTSPPQPTMYLVDVSPDMDIVIKTARTDGRIRDLIAQTLRQTDPQQAFGPVKTMSAYVAASLARQRFVLALVGTFAGFAVSLCGIGVYGVFSYSVSRRMREFGIRTAIGARRADLALQIFKECLVAVVPGLIAGFAISAASAQILRTLLYRISPSDPFSSALATVWVLACCVAATGMPALRASRADPAIMLREQ